MLFSINTILLKAFQVSPKVRKARSHEYPPASLPPSLSLSLSLSLARARSLFLCLCLFVSLFLFLSLSLPPSPSPSLCQRTQDLGPLRSRLECIAIASKYRKCPSLLPVHTENVHRYCQYIQKMSITIASTYRKSCIAIASTYRCCCRRSLYGSDLRRRVYQYQYSR